MRGWVGVGWGWGGLGGVDAELMPRRRRLTAPMLRFCRQHFPVAAFSSMQFSFATFSFSAYAAAAPLGAYQFARANQPMRRARVGSRFRQREGR